MKYSIVTALLGTGCLNNPGYRVSQLVSPPTQCAGQWLITGIIKEMMEISAAAGAR